MRLNSILLSAIMFVMILANPVFSSDRNFKWYLGVGYNYSEVNGNISSPSPAAVLDEDGHGIKVLGGYQFNDFFGIEIGYTDVRQTVLTDSSGKDTFSINDINYKVPYPSDDSKLKRLEVRESDFSIPLFVTFSLPLDKVFEKDIFRFVTPFAKAGFHYHEKNEKFSALFLTEEMYKDEDGKEQVKKNTISHDQTLRTSEDFNLVFGAGLNINITSRISIRGEWERYKKEVEDTDFFSGCFIVKF